MNRLGGNNTAITNQPTRIIIGLWNLQAKYRLDVHGQRTRAVVALLCYCYRSFIPLMFIFRFHPTTVVDNGNTNNTRLYYVIINAIRLSYDFIFSCTFHFGIDRSRGVNIDLDNHGQQ